MWRERLCVKKEDGDSKEILSIPIRQEDGRDTQIWHYTKSGGYMVKFGFHVFMERVASMDHLHVPGPWKEFWQLQVPLKMRVMMWRVACDFLPTRRD
ncbi:hypothetical protein LINPERPRIM_LOCUS16876 [Linum perenne]